MFARGIPGNIGGTLDADLTTTAGWLSFGPQAQLIRAAPTGTMYFATNVDYLTSNGTFVGLAAGAETNPVVFPTWPSSAGDSGDAYFVDSGGTNGGSGDAVRDWDVESFALDPSGLTFTEPPMFDPAASIEIDADDRRTLNFPALPTATGYTMGCTYTDHVIIFDLSAGVVGSDGPVTYVQAKLPGDGATPAAWIVTDECPEWDVEGYGSQGGLATEATLGQLGSLAGVPAQLAGTVRWRTRMHFTASL